MPTCSPQEMTVVVLGSYHFGAVHIGWVSGEDIWSVPHFDNWAV